MRKVWLRRIARVGQIALLLVVTLTTLLSVSDWAVSSFAPRRVFDVARDPGIYFELAHSGWSGWNVLGASMMIFPRLPDGPGGLIPNPEGVSVALHLVADRWVTETNAGTEQAPSWVAEPAPGNVEVYIPASATNVQVGTLSEQQDNFQLADRSSGPGEIYDLSKPNGKPAKLKDGLFVLSPYINYTYEMLKGQPHTFRALASYELDFDLPAAFVGYNGIFSGISRVQWNPGLARTGAGLGATGAGQPAFVVGACQCGLLAVAPAPTANYNGDLIWDAGDIGKPVTYEVSTNSWFSEVVADSKSIWFPATLAVLLSVVLPTIFARRARHRKNSS